MEMPTFQIPHDFFKNTGWPSNIVHILSLNKLSWQLWSIWYPFALLKIVQKEVIDPGTKTKVLHFLTQNITLLTNWSGHVETRLT